MRLAEKKTDRKKDFPCLRLLCLGTLYRNRKSTQKPFRMPKHIEYTTTTPLLWLVQDLRMDYIDQVPVPIKPT